MTVQATPKRKAKETGGAVCELPLSEKRSADGIWSERRANNKTRVRRKRELHASDCDMIISVQVAARGVGFRVGRPSVGRGARLSGQAALSRLTDGGVSLTHSLTWCLLCMPQGYTRQSRRRPAEGTRQLNTRSRFAINAEIMPYYPRQLK